MFSTLRKNDGAKLKEKLTGVKTIRVNGMKFVIRKINPLLDFPSDRLPQILTDAPQHYTSPKTGPIEQKSAYKNMALFIEAAVIDPVLVPTGIGDKRGKESGLTAEDLFRDPSMGIKLYHEIYDHSLNHFKGLKKVFFSIGIKLSRLIMCANAMEYGLPTFSSAREKQA